MSTKPPCNEDPHDFDDNSEFDPRISRSEPELDRGPGLLDESVYRQLHAIGVASCRDDTSLALTFYSRNVSPELFEHLVFELGRLLPLWDDLVNRRRTRFMPTVVDEFIWFLKNSRCQGAAPEVVAGQIGIGAVSDFGAVLARRLA
jgi:hypothetical protein